MITVTAPLAPTEAICFIEEVADLARVHKATIRDWVRRGLFPPPGRLGGKRLVWPRSVVEAAIARMLRGQSPVA
jgi:predicted DNA-binding transcriptional regulator AlpA